MDNVLVLTRTLGIFETSALFMMESVWSNGQETGLITWLCHERAEQTKSFPFLSLFFSAVMLHWGQKAIFLLLVFSRAIVVVLDNASLWLIPAPCKVLLPASKGQPTQLHQWHQVVGAVYEHWCQDSYRITSMLEITSLSAKRLQRMLCHKVS